MSQIIRDITEISRCGAQYRADRLAPMGLKACHASYLTEICDCPGISQDQLSQKLQVDKSNVARQVAFLEENGYLQRQPSPKDKRVQQLFATEKAQALILPLKEETDRWEQQLFKVLTPQELETFSSLLKRLREAAESGVADK